MRNADNAVAICRTNHIAEVGLLEPREAGDRGDDTGVGQLQLCAIDLRLIGQNRALKLAYQRVLRVELLPRRCIFRHQIAEAFEVDFRVLQLRLIARERALRLRQRDHERARVNLGEQRAGPHHLSFFEMQRFQFTVDFAAHDGRVRRGNGADGRDCHADVLHARGSHRDRLHAIGATEAVVTLTRPAFCRSAGCDRRARRARSRGD